MPDHNRNHPKIKVLEAVLFSYKALFSNIGYFLHLLFPVGALLLISDMLQFYGEFYDNPVMQYGFMFAQLFFYSLFAISWHRFVILGKSKNNKVSILGLKKHEIAFIFYPLVWLVIIALIIFSFFTLKSLGTNNIVLLFILFICSLILLHYLFRLWIFLPAKAINSGLSIKDVYHLSKGSTIKLLLGFFILSAPLGYLDSAYDNYIYNSYADRLGFSFIFEYSVVRAFELLIALFAITLNAGFISYIYIVLRNEGSFKNAD